MSNPLTTSYLYNSDEPRHMEEGNRAILGINRAIFSPNRAIF
nr:hypothetical protein [Oscillochloris trichoides]